MGAYEFLEVEQSEHLATVTLNRPPLNVLHIPMLRELNDVLESLLGHPALAALVLRGRGKAFSAGVDIADHTPERVRDMIRLFHGLFRKLAVTDALTIAVVQGAALGGGCELAAFCDIVLASDAARFGTPEVQVGAFPPVAACILPRQIGIRKTVELTALGPVLSAQEALRIGLVNQLYPADAFPERVEEYLGTVRKLSCPVVRLAKRATTMHTRQRFLGQLEQVEHLYLDQLMRLADAREGTVAFMEKRPPNWKHA
ncbi:MAG: enoyl-CoA hydratase/isomerase family protein [Planctomycetota bacterium]